MPSTNNIMEFRTLVDACACGHLHRFGSGLHSSCSRPAPSSLLCLTASIRITLHYFNVMIHSVKIGRTLYHVFYCMCTTEPQRVSLRQAASCSLTLSKSSWEYLQRSEDGLVGVQKRLVQRTTSRDAIKVTSKRLEESIVCVKEVRLNITLGPHF